MSPISLSSQAVAALAGASPEPVVQAMSTLRGAKKTRGAWLNRNRYAHDVAALVRDEGTRGIHGGKLGLYVAASVPLHQSDGWGFMARACGAMSRGDWANAIHLGYYAELRAAMSLLAAEGIAVLNTTHVCLDRHGGVRLIRGIPTHRFVWAALDSWGQRPTSLSGVLSSVTVASHPLTDWLSSVGSSASLHELLVDKWLRAWSLDIRRMAEDRDLRNRASYRPSGVRASQPACFGNCVAPIADVWRACEPSSGGSFPNLDRHLLRLALDETYRALKGSRRVGPAFERYIDRSLDVVGDHGLRPFLLRQESPDDSQLVRWASKAGGPDSPQPVLARATILLRLASAVTASLLRAAAFDRGELRFWWEPYGLNHGLWDFGGEPEEFTDLWADVEAPLQVVEQFGGGEEPGAVSIANVWTRVSDSLVPLSQCERVALWSLGV